MLVTGARSDTRLDSLLHDQDLPAASFNVGEFDSRVIAATRVTGHLAKPVQVL